MGFYSGGVSDGLAFMIEHPWILWMFPLSLVFMLTIGIVLIVRR